MASVETPAPSAEPKPELPDYLTDPDAVLKDAQAKWRYGRAPDYSKTRKVYEETKQMSHAPGSLPELVQNLVKNWEVEASFKPSLSDWRTIDPEHYSFAINSDKPQTAEHMLNVGTYNAIINPNEYYSPEYSDFASSHKTFKRMMPTFAWEVLEVYSGPPQVAFRWRHWGVMKNDYVGFNSHGEKVTSQAHGGLIDIQGVTVATVDDKVRLQQVRTWFDPMDMFRQIAPDGVVKKEAVTKSLSPSDALDSNQSVEIDQKPRPLETSAAILSGPSPDLDRTPTSSGYKSSGIKKLVEETSCPFAPSANQDAIQTEQELLGTDQPPEGAGSSEWAEVYHADNISGASSNGASLESSIDDVQRRSKGLAMKKPSPQKPVTVKDAVQIAEHPVAHVANVATSEEHASQQSPSGCPFKSSQG